MNARQWTVRRGSFGVRGRIHGFRVLLIAAVALTVFPLALFANEGDMGIEKDVNGLKVELVIGAAGPKIGQNQVTVRVSDSQAQPVANVEIALVIAMDTSSAMSMDMDKEKSKTVLMTASTAAAGTYEGTVDLGFDGKWVADMELSHGGMTDMAKFEFEVARGGPNWTIIIVFAGAVILVLGGAVLLRSRRPRPAKGSAA